MKLYKYCFALCLILFIGCDLEEKPYTIGESTFQGTTEDAQQLVTGVYNVFWDSFMMKKTYMEWIDMDHDHSCAHNWVLTGAGSGNVTTHWGYNGNSDLFTAFYRMINRVNYAIETIPTFALVEKDAASQLLGECYFLRAFAYFHLVRMYGGVPLRLAYETPRDMKRSSVKEVYEQIICDLEKANESMIEWGSSDNNFGHANKMAAKLLLAKVYATMGSMALAGNVNVSVDIKGNIRTIQTDPVAGAEGIDAQECYEQVKKLCTEFIDRRGQEYDLQPDFLSLWGGNNTRNREFVWAIAGNTNDDYTTNHLSYYYSPIPYNGRGWAGISTHAYDLYDVTDERGIYGVFHYFQTQFSSIHKYGYYRFPDDAEKYPISPNGLPTRGGKNTQMVFLTKWYIGNIASPEINSVAPGYSYTAQDVIMLRFAEAYLLRAEAYNELGEHELALKDLDVIRRRAKASLLEGNTDLNKDYIRSLILNERALELMQEFNRKFDLLRWGLYLKVMNAVGTINGQGSAIINKTREPRSVLYAVPTDEIYANKLFGPNNEGWN